jgi:hypothetical protein
MRIATLLKYAVASVIGFIKSKSAIAIARMQGKERNFTIISDTQPKRIDSALLTGVSCASLHIRMVVAAL